MASEAAAEITAAIESVFKNSGDHSNENIVINVEVGGDSDDETGHRGRRIEVVNSNKKPLKNELVKDDSVKDDSVNEVQTLDKEQLEEDEEQLEAEAEAEEEQSDEDYKYNRKDITYICEKLYRDELLEVFGAETIDDPKMDEGIKAIFEKLIKNEEFKTFLVEMNGLISDPNTAKTETELANLKRNTDYLIFIHYLVKKCSI